MHLCKICQEVLITGEKYNVFLPIDNSPVTIKDALSEFIGTNIDAFLRYDDFVCGHCKTALCKLVQEKRSLYHLLANFDYVRPGQSGRSNLITSPTSINRIEADQSDLFGVTLTPVDIEGVGKHSNRPFGEPFLVKCAGCTGISLDERHYPKPRRKMFGNEFYGSAGTPSESASGSSSPDIMYYHSDNFIEEVCVTTTRYVGDDEVSDSGSTHTIITISSANTTIETISSANTTIETISSANTSIETIYSATSECDSDERRSECSSSCSLVHLCDSDSDCSCVRDENRSICGDTTAVEVNDAIVETNFNDDFYWDGTTVEIGTPSLRDQTSDATIIEISDESCSSIESQIGLCGFRDVRDQLDVNIVDDQISDSDFVDDSVSTSASDISGDENNVIIIDSDSSDTIDDKISVDSISNENSEVIHFLNKPFEKYISKRRVSTFSQIEQNVNCQRNRNRFARRKLKHVFKKWAKIRAFRIKKAKRRLSYQCCKRFKGVEIDMDSDSLSDKPRLMALYFCDECSEKFHTKDLLKKHRRDAHVCIFSVCSLCDLELYDYELDDHISEHSKSSLPCRYCDMSFVNESMLAQHIDKIHKENKRLRRQPKSIIQNIQIYKEVIEIILPPKKRKYTKQYNETVLDLDQSHSRNIRE